MSFDCGSWDGLLKTSLVTMWELMKPSWCPHPNASLIWDMTADVILDLDDDASLHDLAMIHHLLALRKTKQKSNPSTELSEGNTSSDWLRQGTCLAYSSGMDGHVCGSGLLSEHAEWAASPTFSIVWEIEHVGQKWNGVDCGLSRSNGSELDH